MKARKAQGISFNAIVMAAIALVVLAVIVLIFIGKISGWGSGIEDCEAKGGICEASCSSDEVPLSNTECDDTNELCCVPFGQNS